MFIYLFVIGDGLLHLAFSYFYTARFCLKFVGSCGWPYTLLQKSYTLPNLQLNWVLFTYYIVAYSLVINILRLYSKSKIMDFGLLFLYFLICVTVLFSTGLSTPVAYIVIHLT